MTTAFIVLSVLAFLSFFLGRLFFYNHENRFIREKSITISVMIMSLYSVFSIVSMFFAAVPAKPILVFCGFSPFIIGHFATYKRLTYYSVIQLLVFAAGIIYAVSKGLT